MKKALTLAALAVTTALPCAAFAETLTIWTGANRDKDQLETAVAAFTEDLGIEVVVEVVDPDLPQKFQQAAATGDGPDIVMWAHDRLGEWANGGLIQPVSPSSDWTDGVLASSMDAVQFAGQTWGYPVAVEAVTLIYNKDLVDTPPATFEELASAGDASILWDYNNTYFTMPLLMAGGGYAFQKVEGVYDGTTTGVNTDGAIAGAAVLKSLFDAGVMPQGVDYGVMDGAMANGEVAMVLNGPWSWGAYKDAGINVGVAPIPTVGGNTSPSFLGVQAMAVNAASENADLAAELIENYLLTDEGLATWNANGVLGAVADVSAAAAQNDELVSGMLAVAADGVPMPSNPEMGAFWAAMGPALTNITSGTATPADALNDAALRILSE
ncbi:MAG: maltose/maltodextrin ABC transporter substrate-binding protein MalE [Pseudomonadota bacterium]